MAAMSYPFSSLLGAGQPPPPPASEMEVPHGGHQPPLPALPAQPPPGEALLQLAMQAEMGGHPVAMGQGQPMYDHNGQPVEQAMHPLAYGGGQLHCVLGLVLVGAGRPFVGGGARLRQPSWTDLSRLVGKCRMHSMACRVQGRRYVGPGQQLQPAKQHGGAPATMCRWLSLACVFKVSRG